MLEVGLLSLETYIDAVLRWLIGSLQMKTTYTVVSIVVPFWGYLLIRILNMKLVKPKQGTTAETISSLFLQLGPLRRGWDDRSHLRGRLGRLVRTQGSKCGESERHGEDII